MGEGVSQKNNGCLVDTEAVSVLKLSVDDLLSPGNFQNILGDVGKKSNLLELDDGDEDVGSV